MPSFRNNSKSKLRTYAPVRRMFKRNCFIVTVLCGIVALITIFVVFTPEPPSTQITYPESLSLGGSLRTYLKSQRESHQALRISDEFVTDLANSININEFRTVLEPLLVERVVGTKSHENVKNYIINQFTNLDWAIELDTFEDVTPKGKLPFTNIIATRNPSAERYLVLACHYDSKLSDYKFIGATDSAVPCAMLIYIAQILNKSLKRLESNVALKLIFFDGEEAFVQWTATDSIYGARHLAGVWHSKQLRDSDATELHSIDLLVLLDLMGARSPTFYDLNKNSKRWFRLLVNIERRLGRLRLIEKERSSVAQQLYYFHDEPMYDARIEDDHIPFLKKGVPILHLIPTPFPAEWHTAKDDKTVINFHTVKNLLRVIEIFVWQYMHGSSSN